jgi:hypothetical protein
MLQLLLRPDGIGRACKDTTVLHLSKSFLYDIRQRGFAIFYTFSAKRE